MTSRVKLHNAPRNHWVRTADGELFRFYEMDGPAAHCQTLKGKIVYLPPSMDVEILQPLGYTADEEFDCI
jgi:hypothetical protein